MPLFHVVKNVEIAAPPGAVYPLYRDFRQWPVWSPWLLAEPDCRVTHGPDGRSYEWEGRIVGSGRMEILEERAPEFIDYRLTFLKPFKSENRTAFRLDPKGAGSLLTWTMDGALPWFMFWMKGMMTSFIGTDYARGLAMLKDLAETGSVPSRLEFVGRESFAAMNYVGIRSDCAISAIGEQMTADFERLDTWRREAGLPTDGRVVSIYHKWEAGKGKVTYTVATEVRPPPDPLPDGLVRGMIPATDVHSIRHTGPYRHLGNAWAAGMMHGRNKVFVQNKKLPPFELYEDDPATTPESELRTLVLFPLK